MKIYKSVTELVGGTPILELSNYEKKHNLKAVILAKLEYFNPAGSVLQKRYCWMHGRTEPFIKILSL